MRGTVGADRDRSPCEPAGQVPSAGLSSAIRLADLADKAGNQCCAGRGSPRASAPGGAKPCRRPLFPNTNSVMFVLPLMAWFRLLDPEPGCSAAFLLARNRPKSQAVEGRMIRIRSTDGRCVNATFVRHWRIAAKTVRLWRRLFARFWLGRGGELGLGIILLSRPGSSRPAAARAPGCQA